MDKFSDLTLLYCYGYVTIPVLEACRRAGLFKLLDRHEFRERTWLVKELKTNEGYFTIALEVLESAGWLERKSDAYRLTSKAENHAEWDVMPLYAITPEQLVMHTSHTKVFAEKIDQFLLRGETEGFSAPDPACGSIIVPLVVALQEMDAAGFREQVDGLDPSLSQRIIELFVQQGWLAADKSELTVSGKALIEAREFRVAASYRPILHGISDLLFGDPARLFGDPGNNEQSFTSTSFLQRDLSQEAFFDDLKQEIIEIFSRQPLETQPRVVVDNNWGCNTLLDEIFLTIRTQTLRGRHLAQMPIMGVARHHRVLEEAAQTTGKSWDHVLSKVTDQPDEFSYAIEQYGAKSEQQALHLRFFVDHLLEIDAQQPVNQNLSILADDQPRYYLDRQGRFVDALAVLSCWQLHLRTLAQDLNDSRLLLLEAHAAPSQHGQDPTLLHLDWVHRLAHEYLISAEAFITLAASVGLFNDGCVKRYPWTSALCQISLHHFTRRDYIIRHAAESDLQRLCKLEKLCWQHTQIPPEQIRSRLRQYPQGQFVLEKDGRVLGVIYSQRIESTDALMTCNAAEVHNLHRPSGPIIQLLAVNIDPQAQNASYGDQLLEFMLQRCSLITGVQQVAGVTLCKSYDAAGGQSFEQYIQQQGSKQDPILAFHHSHGAQIVQTIPNYRPQDHANLGNGVLVVYDSLNRAPRRGRRTPDTDVTADAHQVREFVKEEAARLLGVNRSALDIERPFMEMGLDSADLLQLQRRLEEKSRLELQAGFFFEHSNIRKVMDYLSTRLAATPDGGRADSTAQISVTPRLDDSSLSARENSAKPNSIAVTDVAIVGMSCKLPGGIETPNQLWQTLEAKKCVIGTFPATRRHWPTDLPAIDQGGFVTDAEAFDGAFFRMSRAEAEITDPQQRILLQLAWTCLEDAGILPEALKGSNTGVFIGASNCDYSRLIQDAGLEVEAHYGVGSSLAVLANRLSYFFDFSGPSLLIDTACSSSLVALHTAIQSLRSRECATALVGGVNLICHPDLSIAYHKAGMLARDGRCKAFDAKADGYVRAEGAVMLLLKPLSAAVVEGGHIYAVIKGSAINHGGLAAGLTVPNPQKQSELLIAAWQDAGIAAHDLTYIEAHGTGTSLGDPIEIQGIQAAYVHLADQRSAKPCAIGSIKSNLGHLEPAAGITGLLKTVLSLQHHQIPASIHCDRLNPKIHLKDTPFFIPSQLREWDPEGPRIAGVSSFGSGGANAHVVVQEHHQKVRRGRQQSPDHLFIMSAATHERLRIYAMKVIAWLEKQSESAEFIDAIYTWQTGRTAMKQRLAIKVKNHTELLSKLRQWLVGNNEVDDLWSGQAVHTNSSTSRVWETKSGQQLIDQALLDANLEHIGILWTSGVEIDWDKFYESKWPGEDKPRRISLPTYPFAKDRYWIDTSASNQGVQRQSSTGTAAVLHPLLHGNTSNLNEVRFSSRFTGHEFFLADHLVKGAKVLPGVCHLELARAAVMASVSENESNDHLTVHLRNVVWMSPISVDEPQRVHISVWAGEQEGLEFEIYSKATGSAADAEIIHSHGKAYLNVAEAAAVSERLDWLALRAGCNRTMDAAHCYTAFSAMGIEYGPGHRGIRSLSVGRNTAGEAYVWAEVGLPECVKDTRQQYVLHPSVLDSALQASMGLVLADTDLDGNGMGKPSLPFELEEIEILDGTPEHAYIYVREKTDKRPDAQPGKVKVRRSDIDVCDESGRVCVRLKGFTSRVLDNDLRLSKKIPVTALKDESLIVTMPLVPAWDAVMPPTVFPWPSAESRILVAGGTAEEKQAIRARYTDVHIVELDSDDLQGRLEQIHAQGPIEHVVWLTLASEATGVTDERLIVEQSLGVLSGLRLINAFLHLGYERRNPGWTIVTRQTQAVWREEHIQPSHASIHGLIGSLAKEYAQWKIRLVDLPLTGEWPLDGILSLPADAHGDAWAYRAGEWYRQQLIPCEFPATQAARYRPGGVYVIIGGAGGIGEAFSEHLIRDYGAQVVWIGRRELNTEIQTKLDRLAALGAAPSYVRADATNRDQLAQAYEKIKTQHGRIHGLVHAAIVLGDKSLAQMDEARFRASLAAKADVSVRMAQVFAHEQLDWVFFFSSLLSFVKPAGQSNYLAGCTFEDAFAHQLSQTWSCPVKIINWGYWGTCGIVASDAYRARMAQNGFGSIEPEEGMAVLEQFLSVPLPQLALAKGQSRVLETMAVLQDQITLAGKYLPDSDDYLSSHTNRVFAEPAAQDLEKTLDMQGLMAQLLFDQLRRLGLLDKGQAPTILWKQQEKIPSIYDRWFDESVRILAREGYVTVADDRCIAGDRTMPTGESLWSEWDRKKSEWLSNARMTAYVRLVDATLRALPEILTGKRLATDVLFPNGSVALVEGFYKNNPVADYFNAVLADAVVEFVELRRKHDTRARLRIIEIGAGTGGTSEGVFQRLQPYVSCIAEYCYTDVSKAFLMYAEQAYGDTTPYLTYRLLNIEQALESQGIDRGTYDLVIATNVLHATRNIRNTLRNTKALLRPNGVLLLNELLGQSLFTHLTFGLLEGWWLYEDTPIRVPGTPTLTSESWQRVLESEGFRKILFPAFPSHVQGQQVIVAQSDSVIRQTRKKKQDAEIRLLHSKKVPESLEGFAAPRQTTLALAENARLEWLRDKATASFKKIVGQALKLPAHEIDSSEELEKYGIDSILIVSMVDALRNVFAHVSSTVFFEYRTIDALVNHFLATEEDAVRLWVGVADPEALHTQPFTDSHDRNSASLVKPAGRRRHNPPVVIGGSEFGHGLPRTQAEDIAIIGLSGRYPQAADIEVYWRNLCEGKDCIIEIPRERWDWRQHFSEDRTKSGFHYSKLGGFIAGVDEFDPLFFNIAPSEAKYIDPQERLFLQHAWMAIEDAGYTRANLQSCEQDLGGQVGVYAGVMYSEYQLFNVEANAQSLKMGFAGNLASIANRVSYFLNLHGPSMTVDTMCSSSLTAIHVACQDLKQRRTSLAIAGGVNVTVHPNKYLMLSAGQFISSDGHCQSFGSDGDGFIPAEGVGVVILKRLSDAERDGDHIYGVIRGSAINHGGKTNGYTVPNPQAQSNAIMRALAESQVEARHVSYIEAHGTGTKLGDPIEIAALSKAFQQHTEETGFCRIGSVKSNIGHCESAAGIAGLTKVLLQMQHQQIVPSLHAERLNPHIDFEKSPFMVNRELRRWEQPEVEGKKVKRIAGISSFGAGGSNAHMIVEEYEAEEQGREGLEDVVMLLSARTGEQLKQRARDLWEFIRPRAKAIDLVSMAYTLQVGREAMDERVGFLVSSVEQLVEKLQAYVAGEQNIESLYQGQVKRGQDGLSLFSNDVDLQQTIEKWIGGRKLSKLLELWVKGLEVDWSKLYGKSKLLRMSLPTYPFAKERYWVEIAESDELEESFAIPQPVEIQPVFSDVLPEITATLKMLLANELQMRESDIGENVQFVDLGLDSITGVTWVRKINEKYQASIEAIKLYSYPTLAQLSRYVKEEAEKHGTLPKQDAVASLPIASQIGVLMSKAVKRVSRRTRPGRSNSAHSIAVIGMAGQFPKAKDLDEFWRNIAQGRNCIAQVPPERWDVNAYYHPDKAVAGKTNCKWFGSLEEYDQFDPLFFNISPKEAESMDPQQRLLLQACWHTIENAGYSARSLAGVRCGVFVGCTHGDYHLLSREQQLSAQGFTGDATSILAGRISYFLDLQGPCLSIDTACSSSLVAIANACDSLVSGSSDLALAGGVYVMAGPEMHIKTAQAGMLSPEGKCFTFDQRADGFVPGEGVGVVMLKRLGDAQRDGDIIHGVIEGWGINQDGKTNGITAPNLESQTRLQQEVYDKYQVDPAGIQLIEAHGTGTKLGDPIEVEGLKKAFGKYTHNKQYCALGSVKSSIGHCLTAAGIAGFIKLLLALRHKQLPPTINFERLNEHIDLEGSPFYVNNRLQEWELNGADRRRAAINSLGFSGTNAHIVVGEYLPAVETQSSVLVTTPDTKTIVPLSARTAGQLTQRARDLWEFIRPRVKAIDLVSMAYTLQVGREAMDERVGFLVSSVEQLVEKLQAYVAGKQGLEDVYQGQVKGNKEFLTLFSKDADLQQAVERWIAGRKLPKLLELWAKGLEVDWSKLYGESRPQRVSLPVYPFAKERYWIERSAVTRQEVASGERTAVLHPLLHSNTSDLSQQSYSTIFSGEEFFLKEHQVQGEGVLPAGACLEMARVAAEKAAGRSGEGGLELRHVVWGQPVMVRESRQVNIALLANDGEQIDFEIYSGEGEEEVIHCQGQVAWSGEAAPSRVNIEELRRQMSQSQAEPGSVYAACALMGLNYGPSLQAITAIYGGGQQVLAQLRLPETVTNTSGDYVLHPSLIEGALQAARVLSDGSDGGGELQQLRLPLMLESLRVMAPCSREMLAWVRCRPDSQAGEKTAKVDIDLCDEHGNISVQMRGMSWQPVSLAVAKQHTGKAAAAEKAAPEAAKNITRKPVAPREIVFVQDKPVTAEQVKRAKPSGIALAMPGALAGVTAASSQDKRTPTIALSIPTEDIAAAGSVASAVAYVKLYDEGQGIFSIQVEAVAEPKQRRAHLLQAIGKAQQEPSIKVVKLTGLELCFGRGGREDYNQAVEQKLYEAIVSFPYPVIAVLKGNAVGASWMAAALCDLLVCNEDASYGYTDVAHHFYPTVAETKVLEERFGAVQAQDLLFVTMAATGRELRGKGWTCAILPGEQMEAYAQELAGKLAEKSQTALRLLKQHLTRHLAGMVKELKCVEPAAELATETASRTAVEDMSSTTGHIRIETWGENIALMKFLGSHRQAEAQELIAEITAALEKVQSSGCNAVVLASEDGEFLSLEPAIAGEVVQQFQRLLMRSEVPIVAALEQNAKGAGWLISQFCDGCVYSRTGRYSAAEIGQSAELGSRAAASFIYRFGKAVGQEILLSGSEYLGGELEGRVGTLLMAEPEQVLGKAVEVAERWARLPQATLTAWKKHRAEMLEAKVSSMAITSSCEEKEEPGGANSLITEPRQIALRSEVVAVTAYPEGIVVVKMEDREAKNMFSEQLLEGVTEGFRHIEQQGAGYKVVVLSGYESYFSCGGTKENLLAIQGGKARFTDHKLFQLPLDCKLPVIAAMQGHGIGAGWTLGMFADVVVLSEESRYVSPYMNYGFTPGAGATWVLGEKLGEDLARESLLTGEQCSGKELKARGVKLRVLPRAEVQGAAMKLARQIAQTPRGGLINLKQQLKGNIGALLEETYRLELAMHEKTFVGQSETLAQIHKNFYQQIEESVDKNQEEAATAETVADDNDILRTVTAILKALLANELQMQESDVDEDVEFVELGLDSISGVTWVRKINEKYRTSIEATKVYSYPTLAQLSRYVKEEAERHGLSSPAVPPAKTKAVVPKGSSSQHSIKSKAAPILVTRRKRKEARFNIAAPRQALHYSQPIAVIGMAGQFPQARDLEEFWRNIAQGRNCIAQVSSDRWDVNTYYEPGKIVAGKTNSQWVGSIADYDRFDPLFFNISPTEAEYMDPQQRLFLQACWHSIENAGYDVRSLSGKKCGVFVGCTATEYAVLSPQQRLSAQGFTGNALSILAGRISYFLNLQGPCLSIDTACSSSLVAIADACDSLISGDSDVVLTGGVYVMAGPEMHIKTAQAGMLSSEGKCFTFDQRADGFVPGEGVGVVMLKRLADAQRDQDIIYGIIEGWGVNQDGKTNGITAPNPDSQTRLQQEIYNKYRIDPASIQLIEAHGTGTKLGDPIEVEGLKNAFKPYTQNKEYCALGSVKSNIGHCMPAAGVAGLIKLILALQHRQLPPTINFERLNEHIELKDSPFYINTQLEEWKLNGTGRRRAAINSLGFSGTNAHIVVSEYLPPSQVKSPVTVIMQNAKIIVPLSAKGPEQLKQKACDLSKFIRNKPASELVEIAYTLQVGREAMDERVGFLVNSAEQLAEKLEAYARGEQDIEGMYQGQVKCSKENIAIISQDDEIKETIIERWIAQKKLSKLLDLWVKGVELDWNKLYGEVKPQRISLPVYPFARERYWITAVAEQGIARSFAADVLHPLLHRNTSNLNEQRYSSTFTGEEFFLADHRVSVNGSPSQKVLPGVAYLEMARAAIELAASVQPESSVLELRNTVWLKPVVVAEHKQISVGLIADENDQINFEIYSVENDQETVHCQGQAVFCRQPATAKLNLEQLKMQMGQGRWEAAHVYALLAAMGLNYGPAHQGINAIYLGKKQVLAQLCLPGILKTSQSEYLLHPSLMDSALQACIGLMMDDKNQIPDKPYVPFILESLRILSPCTGDMFAWLRHSQGSTPERRTIKLDIDLCDHQGNICVQMHGFASRPLEAQPRPSPEKLSHISAHAGSNGIKNGSSFDSIFYQKLITDVINHEVSVDKAVELALGHTNSN